MASLRNVNKNFQRLHRERNQPEHRRSLGYLEKKKDYKVRANDFHKKQNTMKLLRQKALDKNPDEFHFHMVNSELRDGRHFEKRKAVEFTDDQLKLMQSQDVNYVAYKYGVEMRKVEKLRATLHLLDVEGKPKNKHTFFTDTKEEASNFDICKRLNTVPELLGKTYNVPRLDNLKAKKLYSEKDVQDMEHMANKRDESYKELTKRVERQKQLKILLDKMMMKSHIMRSKGKGTVTKEKEGDATAAPVYKWTKERKR